MKYTDPTGMWQDNHDGTYTAEKGDTLWSLSVLIYNDGSRWGEFKRMDGDAVAPKALQPGMTFASPDAGRGKTLSPSLTATQGPQADSKITQVGIGVGAFVVLGAGLEVGLSYSDKEGLDVYLTVGIGYGFGASTKFIGDFNVVSATDLHLSTGQTATAGMGLAVNFDMKANQFTGVSGLAAGGGVLHTGTITLKGLLRSLFDK